MLRPHQGRFSDLTESRITDFPWKELLQVRVAELFRENKLTDVTIKIGQEVIEAHKVVLYTYSTFFAEKLVGEWKDKATIVLDDHDDDPMAIKAIIQFMYLRVWQEHPRMKIEWEVFYPGIYKMATKYGVDGLMDLMDKIVSVMSSVIFRTRDFHDFINLVSNTYTSENRLDLNLRPVLVHVSVPLFRAIEEIPEFQDVMRKFPNFASDVREELEKEKEVFSWSSGMGRLL